MASISRRFGDAAPQHTSIEAERAYARTLERLAGIEADTTTIGRYEVVERLGEGGAGIVYACRDPELDRSAAVKVLRTRGHADLAREAAMLARLAHPNVVQVYDVGEHDGRVFVAMEHVSGLSLDRWLQQGARTWEQLREVFAQIAAGLAAAHAAGLVHCDVKPSNVLVGEDGRARIADFGLARLAEADDASTIAGTPAYMAPEQAAGERPDARSDQFGYFATLYDAVHGVPPRRDVTRVDVAAETTGSDRSEHPPLKTLPRGLSAVLRRGLDPDPQRRFPSMEAAADALPRKSGPGRKGVLLVATVAVTAAVWAGVHDGVASIECPLDTVAWSSSERDAAIEGLAPHGAAARVVPMLDAYASHWRGARTQACSEPARDEAVVCLGHARASFVALSEDLAVAEPGTAMLAATLAGRLVPPPQCLERGPRAPVAPPPHHLERAVADGRRELRAIEPLLYVSRLEEARTRIEALSTQSVVSQYAPLRAEVEHLRGIIAEQGGRYAPALEHFEAAHRIGTVARHDRVAATSATAMAFSLLQRQGDPGRAEVWRRYAEAALERLRWPADLTTAYERHRNLAAIVRSDMPAALAHATAAARLAEDAFGPGNGTLLQHLVDMADGHARLGRLDEAEALLALTEPALVTRFGRRHILIQRLRMAQGSVALIRHDFLAAAAAYREADRIVAELRGPGDLGALMARQNYATVLVVAGLAEEAVPLFHDSLEPMAALLPAGHSVLLYARLMFATALSRAGRMEEAARELAPLESGFEALGDTAGLASVTVERATLLRGQGDLERAHAMASQGVELWVAALGPDDPDVAVALRELGAIEEDLGNLEAARAAYERALAIDAAFTGPDGIPAGEDRAALAGLPSQDADDAG